ncbi:MAG: hypothetical protein A3H27_07190 [Acidobacteria bacterium RIFCSPLOWO2_02_FULL_59_13]|nr:MAG: hypothetical protein A3H27_07190 [Acidobacteria bacterium RIFCSPLOWO2_02_FULL_59_13]
MRLKLAAMVAALLFSGAAPLLAQESTAPQPRRPVEALKTILDLTDQQLQQLGDLRQAHQQQIQRVNTRRRELAQQQRELLQSENPDPAQLGSLLLEQRNLRQRIQAAAKTYRESALGVLTQTQRDKITQIQEALKLVPQAGPLAAFGLIEGPGHRHRFNRRIHGPGPGPMGGEAPAQPMGGPGFGGMMMGGQRGN